MDNLKAKYISFYLMHRQSKDGHDMGQVLKSKKYFLLRIQVQTRQIIKQLLRGLRTELAIPYVHK